MRGYPGDYPEKSLVHRAYPLSQQHEEILCQTGLVRGASNLSFINHDRHMTGLLL